MDWKKLLGCLRRVDPGPWAGVLTGPEAKVAACLLVQKGREREIASRLHLSRRTVHGYMNHIFRKLNVHSRKAASLKLKRMS
jgi:DNA-binding CsgD family transcriptional regulator